MFVLIALILIVPFVLIAIEPLFVRDRDSERLAAQD
jgi:hypothetical protein